MSTTWSLSYADRLIGWDEILLENLPVRMLSFDCGELVLTTIDEFGGSTLHCSALAQNVEDSVQQARVRFCERVSDLRSAELMVGG